MSVGSDIAQTADGGQSVAPQKFGDAAGQGVAGAQEHPFCFWYKGDDQDADEGFRSRKGEEEVCVIPFGVRIWDADVWPGVGVFWARSWRADAGFVERKVLVIKKRRMHRFLCGIKTRSECLQVEYHFEGIVIAVATFVLIGLFHPIVIKTEYYFGTKCWPVFAILGVVALLGSVWTDVVVVSAILGVLGCTLWWSILELFEQKKRVEKGWYPKREKG